jgi:hypothetical protein
VDADALAGFETLGWRPLDPMETHYRVRTPGALLADRTDERAARVVRGLDRDLATPDEARDLPDVE